MFAPRRKDSEEMINPRTTRRNFGPIEEALGALPWIGQELLPLLATQEALAALVREQEHATIEAEDVLSQADEALVMG